MARRVWPWLIGSILVSVAGCGVFEHAERPAWRDRAEEACIASKLVQPSAFLTPSHPIEGPGICGLNHPFKVSGLANGTVAVEQTQTLDCSMIPALEQWLAEVVQPAAQARFGQPVTTLSSMGSYSCRSIDNLGGAQLSEHAFANAIDIGGFRLADGRVISVVKDWKRADTQESAFLHEVHAGACQVFTTVLGPGADVFHYNHIHLDLAMHGSTDTGPRRYCKPIPNPSLLPAPPPTDGLPPAPDIEEPQDVAGLAPAAVVGGAPMPLHDLSGAIPDQMRAYDTAPRPSPPAPMPAPAAEGRPSDWDITSAIR
jgi:hypothetical protein